MANAINKVTGEYIRRGANAELLDADWIISPTAEEVEQYLPKPSLDDLKSQKVQQIDIKTVQLINQGFDYNGTHFSSTLPAQSKWNGLYNKMSAGRISAEDYPLRVVTFDDSEYFIADEDTLKAIYDVGFEHVNSKLESGLDLKIQVKNATTETELDAVVDNRV